MLKDLETVPATALIAELHRMLVAGGLGAADTAEYVRLFDLAADRTR